MINLQQFNIIYQVENSIRELQTTVGEYVENEDLSVTFLTEKTEISHRLKVMLKPQLKIRIKKMTLCADFSFSQTHSIFLNGYQSWTESPERKIDEKQLGLNTFLKPLYKKYKLPFYGDSFFKSYSRKKGDFHGYTFGYIRDGENFSFIGSLNEHNGFTILQTNVSKNKFIVEKDLRGIYD